MRSLSIEDKETKLKNPNTLNEGMQVLREYILFCNFNFGEVCRKYDKGQIGSIPEKFLREIILSELRDSPFYFTEENLSQIIFQAPMHSSTKQIDYQKLYNSLVNGPKPKTSFHIYRNKIMKQELGLRKVNKLFSEEIARMFKADTDNFFDRKPQFDFRNFDLSQLDVDLLSKRCHDIKFVDSVQEKLAEFYKINNETILDNFEIKVAQKFAHSALPLSSSVFIPEEKMDQAILDFLGVRRGQKSYPYMLKDEFIDIVRLKLPQIQFTTDEVDLLFQMIWQREDYGEFSVRSLTRWIQKYRVKKLRDLIQVNFNSDEQSSDRYFTRIEMPKIFKELVNTCKVYGINFIEYALSPYVTLDKKVEFENLRILLRSLEIGFNLDEMNQFQLYCAHQGLLMIKDKKSETSKIQIDLKRFLSEINQQLTNLYPLEQKIPYSSITLDEKLPLYEGALIKMVQQIIQTFLIKIQNKLKVYQDDDLMVDELKLRMVLSEEVTHLDHDNLRIILQNIKNQIHPKFNNTQRKFYLPEVIYVFEKHFMTDFKLQSKSSNVQGDFPNSQTRDNYMTHNTENIRDQSTVTLKTGKFINAPENAFAVGHIDDKIVMEKLRLSLEQNFTNIVQMKNESSYKRSEVACDGFYQHLKKFDQQGSGLIEKNKLNDVLQKLFHNLNQQETFSIIDFALNVSSVADEGDTKRELISYPFLCLQLCKYYQMSSLRQVMNEVQVDYNG